MTLTPVAPDARIQGLDVLRGLALFGVLLVNLQHFAVPVFEVSAGAADASAPDRAAFWLLRFAFENKFYTLLSFLFGYGFAVQMIRAASAGRPFAGLHLWRMGLLLLIGVAHSLVWNGDILSTYALLGLLLLPLRRAPTPALLGLGALLLLLPTLGLAVATARAEGPQISPDDQRALQEAVSSQVYPLRQSCYAFAMFCWGLAAGRAGLLARRDAARLVPLAGVALLVTAGLLCNVAATVWRGSVAQGTLSPVGVAIEATLGLGAPALAVGWALAALAALESPRLRGWVLPLAHVGRTTLTNYLLQTAIGVGIVAQLPAGWVGAAEGLALTVAIFALQTALSRAWLARYRFGPVEWLWRSATYGSWQPQRPGGARTP